LINSFFFAADAAFQTALFVLLSASMALGTILYFAPLGDASQWGLIYMYLIPSLVMLRIMWRRKSSIATLRSDALMETAWGNQDDTDLDLSSMRDGSIVSAFSQQSDQSRGFYGAHDGERVVRGLHCNLIHSPPLLARLEFKGRGLSAAATAGMPTKPNAFFFELSEPTHDTLCILEDLRLPDNVMPLTRLFLLSVVLPPMEKGLAVHRERVAALLDAYAPTYCSQGTLYGDLEQREEYIAMKSRFEKLTERYTDFVQILRLVSLHMPTSPSLKRSNDKKMEILSYIPTNINVHSSTVQTINETNTVCSVTFGCPAGQALGFSHGGLRAGWAALKKSVAQYSTPRSLGGHAANRSLENLYSVLSIKFW
jgi:hypothetical protein